MWTLCQSGEGRRRDGLAPCSVFHKASLMFTAAILKKPSDPPHTKADAVGLNAAGLVGVIVECGANLADARVQPVLKMYKELATRLVPSRGGS